MIRCAKQYQVFLGVADVCRLRVIQELHDFDALGIQIDGSCDRQQLYIKFVTARKMELFVHGFLELWNQPNEARLVC